MGGELTRGLLRGPVRSAGEAFSHADLDGERLGVLRALLLDHGVVWCRQLFQPRQFLQRTLVVGSGDIREWLKRAKITDDLREYKASHPFEASIKVKGGDERFYGICQEGLLCSPSVDFFSFSQKQKAAEFKAQRCPVKMVGVNEFGLHLSEAAFGNSGKATEEVFAHYKAQHRVTEVFELFVLIAEGSGAAHSLSGKRTVG